MLIAVSAVSGANAKGYGLFGDQIIGPYESFKTEVIRLGGTRNSPILFSSGTADKDGRILETFRLSGPMPTQASIGPSEALGFLDPEYLDSTQRNSYRQICKYDPQGRMTEMYYTTITDGKKTDTRYVYTYDTQGRMNKQATYQRDKLISASSTEFDGDGRVARSENFSADKLQSTTVYTYDAKGNQTEMRTEYADPKERTSGYRSVTEFDGQGRTVRMATYNGDDFMYSEQLQKYDDQGGVVQTTYLNYVPDKAVATRTVTNIGADGRVTSEEHFDFDGKLTSRSETSTKDGETVTTTYGADGKVTQKSISRQDDKGGLNESTAYDAEGKVIYSYKSWQENKETHSESIQRSGNDKYTRTVKVITKDFLPKLEQTYDGDKLTRQVRYEYHIDKHDNWTKVVRFETEGTGPERAVSMATRLIQYRLEAEKQK